MPFVGTPIVSQISDSIVRVHGCALASSSAATIGLAGSLATPDLILPASFAARTYGYQRAEVVLQDSVSVQANFISQLGSPAGPIAVNKQGTTPENFLIQLAAPVISAGPPQIDVYIRFHD